MLCWGIRQYSLFIRITYCVQCSQWSAGCEQNEASQLQRGLKHTKAYKIMRNHTQIIPNHTKSYENHTKSYEIILSQQNEALQLRRGLGRPWWWGNAAHVCCTMCVLALSASPYSHAPLIITFYSHFCLRNHENMVCKACTCLTCHVYSLVWVFTGWLCSRN